jgi:hypothetical protein
MARYRLRYFFDPGADICFWAANDAARERFGYPINARELPLTENTWRRLSFLTAWYDTSIDWDYPPDPSPWDDAERERFNREAQRLLAVVREELGSDFEVVDESETADAA